MARLKGIWYLNDTLTAPSAEITAEFAFTFAFTFLGGNYVAYGNKLVAKNENGADLRMYVYKFNPDIPNFPAPSLENPYTLHSYYGGEWEVGIGELSRTLTIPDQVVSDAFYNWFVANATCQNPDPPIDPDGGDIPINPTDDPTVTIEYNGSCCSTFETGKTARLKCEGTKMLSDVVIKTCKLKQAKLQEKTATSNGTVTPDTGYNGLSKVKVQVPVPDSYIEPSGVKIITENGSHDVTNFASAFVNVEIPELPEGAITPTGAKTITSNGDHDVTQYATAKVNVPIPDGYVKPTGSKTITTNGSHDVTNVASATVNVPIPDGYVKPTGSKTISSNGTHDVTSVASAVVNVPIPEGYIKPSGTKEITIAGGHDVREYERVNITIPSEVRGLVIPQDQIAEVTFVYGDIVYTNIPHDATYKVNIYGPLFDSYGVLVATSETIEQAKCYYLDSTTEYYLEFEVELPNGMLGGYDDITTNLEVIADSPGSYNDKLWECRENYVCQFEGVPVIQFNIELWFAV